MMTLHKLWRDEAADWRRISRGYGIFKFILVVLSGALAAAALPPLNWEWLGWVALAPLVWYVAGVRWPAAALAGFGWEVCRSLPAFFFLREIDPSVPYLLAPVIGIWTAVFGVLTSFIWKYGVFPIEIRLDGFEARREFLRRGGSFGRLALFTAGTAAIFVILGWSRSRMLPWNDLDVTQWRNLALIQLARFTGSCGVVFAVALVNCALAAAWRTRFRGAGLRLLLAAVAAVTLVMLYGAIRLVAERAASDRLTETVQWKPLLVQGDLSQRRNGGGASVREAIVTYMEQTIRGLQANRDCDIVIWPESAVPVPYRAAGSAGADFRYAVNALSTGGGKPMLIGALDFETRIEPDAKPGMTNSALYFAPDGRLIRKYDKIHRVPYGEYIPFRRFLPSWLVSRIDMNRDLVPGTDFSPFELGKKVRAGVAICFEGSFGYVTREFARRGANVLLVISNDAWYPTSSEPELHLANSVMRAVETGLPMVRCGNNGGSLVVAADGSYGQILEVPGAEERLELRRGRGFRMIDAVFPAEPEPTWFVRYGEWFIGVMWLAAALSLATASVGWYRGKRYFAAVRDATE